MQRTYKILISGQVQGVGFRPYVYNLAKDFSLKGSVSNNENGVIILVQGSDQTVKTFYDRLINFPPPVSKIKEHSITEIQSILFNDFNIVPSKKEGQLNLILTPDFAICEDCKEDIKDIDPFDEDDLKLVLVPIPSINDRRVSSNEYLTGSFLAILNN